MSVVEETTKRRGGRAARKALRAAPIPIDEAAVRPGMEGGQYKPLSERGMQRIHEAALHILETVGMCEAIPSCIETMTAMGCTVDSDGRILIPRSLVEDTIANANRSFQLYGQDPRHDLDPHGKKIYFGTAGAAVHVAEPETNIYRESVLTDLYDAGRLVDSCDHIHFYQRSMVARDMEDPRDLDINTLYACVSGTTKHVGTSLVTGENTQEALELLHLVAGSEAAWRARPFVSMSCCFVVPPLKFAEDACRCLEVGVRGGMPILLLAAGQAGATSPAALAGAVVQEIAECLAGLVYVNSIVPGAPAIMGPWPFVSDLRTGAMSGGSGEQALLTAGCGQMGQFYDLSMGSAAGMCDSKMPDIQAGYEKGMTAALAGVSGLNLMYESVGMHASLLGFCHESLLIDNDMIGSINRNVRGIEVTEETLATEAITSVCREGPGHFLGHEQTLSLMQSEYVYPELGNRMSPKEWHEAEKPDIVKNATAMKKRILSSHFPSHISDAIDAKIRENHNIMLPREYMQPQ